MARSTPTNYQCEGLKLLAGQLLLSPEPRRIEQIRRAQRLHDEIDANAAYPLEFIIYRITAYRSEHEQEDLLVGAAVLVDLRLLIDQLSHSVRMPPDPDEDPRTPQDLAHELGVSERTLTRWRSMGLRWRWVWLADDDRQVVMYSRQAVARFLRRYPQRVAKAARYSRLDETAQTRVIERARRLVQARDLSLNQVATHLARRLGRSLEGIRQLLEKHDRQHSDDPIFADRTAPLSQAQRRAIAQAHARGESLTALTRQYKRTRSTLYRALHEDRAAALRLREIRYFVLATFGRPDADSVFLRPLEPEALRGSSRPGTIKVDDLPEPIQPLYKGPLMSPTVTQTLIVRMNYLLFKAARLRENLNRYDPRVADLDAIEQLLKEADALRDRLVQAHLPLVLVAAKQHLVGQARRGAYQLVSLLEVGNQVLIETLDSYDPANDKSLATSLTWALRRRFASPQSAEVDGKTSGRPAPKAARRDEPLRALHRIIEKAGESGVHLSLPREK